MKILVLSNYYPPYEVGGYEQLCRDVVARLAERGHTVEVLTSSRGCPPEAAAAEPRIHRILQLQLDYERSLSPVLQFFFTRRRAEAHNRRCLCSLAAHLNPDVIFIWNLQGLPRSIALEAESVPDVAVAYWLAGYSPAEPDEFWVYWSQPGKRRKWGRLPKSLVARSALSIMRGEGMPLRPEMRHVAVVSEYMRRQGIADDTLPVHARVIYNGVEIEQFFRPVVVDIQGPLRLLQAGRISEDKGVHLAVEAVGKLVHDHGFGNVHLDIAGSGPTSYQEYLQQLARQYDVLDRLSFLGWLPRGAMPELMSRCHVLLLPTVHQEPFARVVLEAMAGGLAVIGTLTGGTGELLQHEVTGLAFAAGDSDDLAAQIKRLALDAGLRRRIATQGQQNVLERYSLDRMVENLEAFLEEAVTSQARQP